MIQGCLILILLKNMCCQRKVKSQHVEISIQLNVLHLELFEKDLKTLDFVSPCYQTNSIDCFMFSIDCVF